MRLKMLRRVMALMASVAGLLSTGCQRVETDSDPFTDFAVYTSFAWDGSQSVAESQMDRDYPHLMADLRDAVTQGLVAKGMQEVEMDAASLLLRAHLELAPYRDENSGDAPATKLGPLVLAPYSVTQADDTEINRELQEGTIMLIMTDRTNEKPVWQAWMRRVIDMDNLRQVEWGKNPVAADITYRHKMIRKAVEKLLAEYPPEPVFRLSAEGRAP